MLDSFFAALNVVLPMLLLMALGALARIKGVIGRPAMSGFDRLIFRLFMPVLLFKNIYDIDLSQDLAWREMIFAAVGLAVSFLAALAVPSRLVKDRGKAAAVAQAMMRPNYILFGVAVAEALYGEGNIGMVIMVGTLVVPTINVLSPVVLEIYRAGRAKFQELLLAILKNPMVVAAILAFIMKALPIGIPRPVGSVIRSVANSTTTISFISLGVGLDLAQARVDSRPLTWGILLRMLVIPAVFMPLSVMMGFRGPSLCAMMILFAAPTAVASYPLAVAMGADGQLAGQLVCATTLLSVITIFLWTFFLRGMGWM